jgi:hypothetical protein
VTTTDDTIATLEGALAKAQTPDELTPLISFAKRVGELALRVKRKAGTMLAQAPKDPGGRPLKTPIKLRGVSEYRRMIERWEISEPTAQRWQQVADVSDEDFEGYITKAKGESVEITESGLLGYAANREQEATPTVWEKAVEKGTTAPDTALSKLIETVVRRAVKGWIDRGGDKKAAIEALRRDWAQIGDNVVKEISRPPLKWEGAVVEEDAA